MTIPDLIAMAQAKLATLNNAKATATARGDGPQIAEIDAEIQETTDTIEALRTLT
jgi:hypothetical protein